MLLLLFCVFQFLCHHFHIKKNDKKNGPTAQPPGLSGLGSPNQPLRQPRRFASRELQGATWSPFLASRFHRRILGQPIIPIQKRERERDM